jgi:hypothetical protein
LNTRRRLVEQNSTHTNKDDEIPRGLSGGPAD